jgi:hypothetical protein
MGKESTRPAHLRVVTNAEPRQHFAAEPAVTATADEARVLHEVAAGLRRSARMLPGRSPLRAELLETALYFEAGAEAV